MGTGPGIKGLVPGPRWLVLGGRKNGTCMTI